jgi:hypothetical protein
MTAIDTFVLCVVAGLTASLVTVVVASRRRQRCDLADLERRVATAARMSMYRHPSYNVTAGCHHDFTQWETELTEADQ